LALSLSPSAHATEASFSYSEQPRIKIYTARWCRACTMLHQQFDSEHWTTSFPISLRGCDGMVPLRWVDMDHRTAADGTLLGRGIPEVQITLGPGASPAVYAYTTGAMSTTSQYIRWITEQLQRAYEEGRMHYVCVTSHDQHKAKGGAGRDEESPPQAAGSGSAE
jgi:hypothetical protein